MKRVLLFIVLILGIFISGCVTNTVKEQVSPTATISPQTSQYLEIVLKDFGLPEVKYLQPTINEIQLKKEDGNWITIWSSPEGKTIKLTSDGAEIVLDRVRVEPGNYIETRMQISSIDVEADINRDGDTLDKNVQIIMTEEEFATLPQQEMPQQPSAPSQPSAPNQPSAPTQPTMPQKPQKPSPPEGSNPGDPQPQEPSQPSQPTEPSQPSQPTKPSEPSQPLPPGVIKIEGGLVYMDQYLNETGTATPPYFDGIHNDTYLYPILKTDFVYRGSDGKLIYDFTLHPLKPKHEQISVEVSTIT